MSENKSLQKKLALALPDIPRWVETRSMLLTGQCSILGLDETSSPSFVVVHAEFEMISVVGLPEKLAIAEAVGLNDGKGIVLSTVENSNHVSDALPEWSASPARLHILGKDNQLPVIPENMVRLLDTSELENISTLPDVLKEELSEVHSDSPIAAAFVDDEPVSFCYAASMTESLWDISIDTLDQHRNKGFAGITVAFMVDYMRRQGREPVWGAEVNNEPSMRLAAKLGFTVVDEIMVFYQRRE